MDLPAEDLFPVFEEVLAEDVDFDLVAGFFVVTAEVAGFEDWAAAPPGIVTASREPTTTANRTFNQLPTLASFRKPCISTVSRKPVWRRCSRLGGITPGTLLQPGSSYVFDSLQSRVVLLSR